VHFVNHRNRGVRFGERSDDGSEGARSEAGPAVLDWDSQAEKPGLPQSVDRVFGEPARLIVCGGGGGQDAIGDILCFGDCDVEREGRVGGMASPYELARCAMFGAKAVNVTREYVSNLIVMSRSPRGQNAP
jgi:hypothetical protein